MICWRIVSLIHVYGIDIQFLSDIFGPNPRSIQRWYKKFQKTRTVRDNKPASKRSRWSDDVLEDVKKYVKERPTFYIEELRYYLNSTLSFHGSQTHLTLRFVEPSTLIFN